MGTVFTALGSSLISSSYNDGTSLINESSVAFSTMEYNEEDEGVEGALVNSKAVPYQLD